MYNSLAYKARSRENCFLHLPRSPDLLAVLRSKISCIISCGHNALRSPNPFLQGLRTRCSERPTRLQAVEGAAARVAPPPDLHANSRVN